MTDHHDPTTITERYVSLWNEPDPTLRRQLIRELWPSDGRQVLDPPEDLRRIARSVGFGAPTLEARGYDALEARVARAHEEFVAPGSYRFRSRGNAARLHDVVKFNWEMVSTADEEVVGTGLDIFVLDGDGRITVDYQFVEP